MEVPGIEPATSCLVVRRLYSKVAIIKQTHKIISVQGEKLIICHYLVHNYNAEISNANGYIQNDYRSMFLKTCH